MKKYAFLFIATLLFIVYISSACEKLPKKGEQEIEKYKNSSRDPQIIGKWKFSTNEQNFINIFREDGLYERANAVYDREGNITEYKKTNDEVYFYTNEDRIYYLTVVRDYLTGATHPSFIGYKIENDTLFIYNKTKGIRADDAKIAK